MYVKSIIAMILALSVPVMLIVRLSGGAQIPWSVVMFPLWGGFLAFCLYHFIMGILGERTK